MPATISIEPSSPFANPTSLSWTGSTTIAIGSRYVIRATPGNSVSTLTVPAKSSHMIQNEGAYPFTVATTGNSSVTLAPGNQLQVAWDDSQSKHENQLTANNAATVKSVWTATYTVQASDVTSGGAVILTPNTTSAVLVWSGGVLVGPLDALYTPSTSVLSWSGLGLEATIEAGEVLQILAIGV